MRPLVAAALVIAALGASSCATLRGWLPPDESQQQAQRLRETQLKVMRFADEYSGRIAEPIQRFNTSDVAPEDRLRAQNWRLSQATSAYTIASGPSPTVNGLDMVVLATLSRMVIEDFWVNELYGTRATALLNVHRSLEQEAWRLAEGMLNENQRAQLRGMIDTWRGEHPQVRAVAHVHFVDFAKTVSRSAQDPSHSGGGLFAFFGLDPLSNLDPAVREIEQTRQLAERTIYYVQRAPNLLDMQIERLAYQLAVMPETKDALVDVNRISLAAAAAGDLASNLPATFARERHATIADLTAALNSAQAQLQRLMSELRETLDAGSSTSESFGATVRALDMLVARFDPGPQATDEAAAPSRPFDITDYTATAREVAAAAQDLRALIEQVDSSSTGVEHLAASASQNVQDLVDHAFWRGVFLILVLGATALAAALAYRWAFPAPRCSS